MGNLLKYYEFGPFRLDTAEQFLRRDGKPVPLSPKAFDILLVLVQRNGHLVGKDELMQILWPDTVVEEANLTQNIAVLRRALGECHDERKYIETIPKRGYRFIASVKELQHEKANQTGTTAALKTIAVLPFKPLSAEGNDEYLGLGIADTLITNLGNIKQIIVRPTSAVLKYTAQGQDPLAAGRQLGVDSLLDGKIQRSGNRIRVTVQLVSVSDERPVWTRMFDGKFSDIFTMQDSISRQVVSALTLELTGEEQRLLTKRYTENSEAYQAYLKGRYFWNTRTEEGFKKAIEYFQRAIIKDPGYALAYAGLADCYNLLSYYSELPPKESFPKAKTAAVKALEADNALAEAHTSLGFVRFYYEWEWEDAEREFNRAIELNPNYSTAHHWCAGYPLVMGRFDEALRRIKKAQELDPLSLTINTNVGLIYYFAQQYDQSVKQLRNSLEMDANFWLAHCYLGRAYEQIGMYEEAVNAFQRAITLSGGNTRTVADLGHAYSVSGSRHEAQKVLDKLKGRSKQSYVSPYGIAMIHTGLGDKDQAFEWIAKAYAERSSWMAYLRIEPRLDSLRTDVRFKDLLRRFGFPKEITKT